MRNSIRRPRGFAVTTALFMVAIIGVAALAIGQLVATDMRRTLSREIDAQLRELLLAAAVDAPSHLANANQPDWTMALPSELGDAKLQAQRQPTTDGATVVITATLAGRRMSEELRFAQSNDSWRLISSELRNR
jgi:type II secretory pathway component PulK